MREIKFRAWDKKENKMENIDLVGDDSVNPRWFFGFRADRYEIMQYTGLLDKNGKEIYEGDVFFCSQCGENRVVTWMSEYAMFTFHRLRVHDGYEVDNEEMEVIGNIYENPELLTP